MSSTTIDMGAVRGRYAADLKAAREREGLTQQEAAAEAGVKYRSWQAWEGQETLPDQANALAVEKRFGVRPTPPYLSSSNSDPPPLTLVHSSGGPASRRVAASVDLASALRRPGRVALEGKRGASSLRSVRDGSSPRTRGRGGG